MKPIVFLFFLTLIPFFSCTRFLQLFDSLEAENNNPNGYHRDGIVNLPTPSVLDYVRDSVNRSAADYSFKQIPAEIPTLSVIIPKNDDYLVGARAPTSVDVGSLQNQVNSLISQEDNVDGNSMEMGTALLKTKEFIEKALKNDLNVGVSKKDLMNLLSFSNKVLDKCQGDYENCMIEKKSPDSVTVSTPNSKSSVPSSDEPISKNEKDSKSSEGGAQDIEKIVGNTDDTKSGTGNGDSDTSASKSDASKFENNDPSSTETGNKDSDKDAGNKGDEKNPNNKEESETGKKYRNSKHSHHAKSHHKK